MTNVGYEDEGAFLDEALEQLRGLGLSIREISRQSGIAYSTLQAIMSGETQQPEYPTLQRIENYLSGPQRTFRSGPHTITTEANRWSDRSMINLAPPPFMTHSRIVYRPQHDPTGYASTKWTDLRDGSPYDAMLRAGVDPRAMVSVIWTRETGQRLAR